MASIKSVTVIDDGQTYDLEVNHPDHQFYLSNGMLTSNSHSILYSMISYKTAYLKTHYPVEFLVANLMAEVNSNTPDAKANMEKIKNELRSRKVKIIPPDINCSQLSYKIASNNQLITGLDALKFVGEDAINDIIEKRPFKNFFDFMARVDSRKVRANAIQALAASGCLDMFGISRKLIYLYCSDYRKKLQVWLKKHDPSKEEFIYPWANDGEWSIPELYALEQFYLGESFVCKPSEAYGKFFTDEHKTISDVKRCKDKTKIAPIKVIVRDFFEFKVKKETSKFYGKSMVKATIEDKNGEQCSCTIFPDRWTIVQERIKQLQKNNKDAVFDVGIAFSFGGTTNNYEDDIGIILDDLFNVAFPPALPLDRKARKVNLKDSKSKIEQNITSNNLFEDIEDQLYDEGLIDLDEENDD